MKMKLTRHFLVAVIALLSLMLTISTITTAQGPGPKGGPFISAAPTPTIRTSAQGPDFRQAAEQALAEYLQAHGPQPFLHTLWISPHGDGWRLQPEFGHLHTLGPDEARRAAGERIRLEQESGQVPSWNNTVLQDPIPLYDLTGEVTAYLFPVTARGKPAGYLTVAAFALSNPVLEFATEGDHPLSRAISRMRATGQEPVSLEHPLYLGLLAYGYEVASPETGIRAVFDLWSGGTVQVSETEARIPLRQKVAAQANALPSPSGSVQPMTSIAAYALISGVPDWNQFWGSYSCYSGCSPTAATNVMGYWDSHGYGNLIYGDDWQGAVNEMRTHMETWCGQDGGGWTNVGNISPGISGYAQAHSYTFASALWCDGCATSPTYDNYRGQIDAGRPLVVDVGNHYYYGSHSVTGVGYDTNGSYMIVHDNWPSTGENVYLQYGTGYTWIYMHPVAPGGSSGDTTPPSGDYTSPSNGATVGRTVHLAAWASDSGSGVREVHFTAKWSGQWHLVYNDTSAPYEYDWDLCASGVPDGDIELGLDIWDNASNEFHLHTVHPNPHITKSYNCSSPSSTWSVDYWNNKYLAGYPNWHNNESGTYIFRDWGDGGPGGGIQVNEWSARFVRTVYFPGGDYRFHCQHDDGCRIYIDGQERVNGWWDSSFDGHDWGGYISPGNHEVKVEYYENQGSARLEVWWQGPGFLPIRVKLKIWTNGAKRCLLIKN